MTRKRRIRWVFVSLIQAGLVACGNGEETGERRREVVVSDGDAAARNRAVDVPVDGRRVMTPADLPYAHELYEIRDVRANYSGNSVRVELQFISHLDIERHFQMPFHRGFMVDDQGQRHEVVRSSDTYVQFQPEVPEWIWVEFGDVDSRPSQINIALPIRSTRDHVGQEWFHLSALDVLAKDAEG